MSQHREVYFHEDDYCQQELLPRRAAQFAETELKEIEDFAEAHRAPGGMGWTEMYIRKEPPAELRELKITREDFASIVSPLLPAFDAVYTGYSTHREQCIKTMAFGISAHCALFANWNDDGIIRSIWTNFFDFSEESILAASGAVAALGKEYPLVYVDWAWGYRCDAQDATTLASMLRSKMEGMNENLKKLKE